MTSETLIFVEDPGAANFIAGWPAQLARHSISSAVFAQGYASDYLSRRDVVVLSPKGASPGSLLDQISPRVVVVGTSENPDTAGLKLLDEARSRGISSVGVVDAPANSALRFRGRGLQPLSHSPDWLMVPDGWTRASFASLGFPEDHIVVSGHPHFDTVRTWAQRAVGSDRVARRLALFPTVNPGQKIVVFAAETSTGLDPAAYRWSSEYRLHGRGTSKLRTSIVLEEFLDAISVLPEKPFLVLRLHPKNDISEFTSYLTEFDQVSQQEVGLDVIDAADAVVGLATMLLTEGVLLGKPTLSILPRLVECGWLATIELGLTDCATTREETEQAVRRLITASDRPDPELVDRLLPAGGLDKAIDFIVSLTC